MRTGLAAAIATAALAVCGTARADNVCVWSEMGVWQCGDGHIVTQVYQLPQGPQMPIVPRPSPVRADGQPNPDYPQ